ncbi:MAG: GNAT family N-acetyltransferase [Acidobacteria bacterium]|nr:MAG: GNAT family N-acetyltransferase [Acidobacteriota bacterium]
MTQDNSPAIRSATAADVALLAELGARTFYETFVADNSPEDMAAYLAAAFSPEQQAAELADRRSNFFVAEIDGRAVGYAQLRAGEIPACVAGAKPIELARMYVSKDWLGQGVGEALMRACLEQARASGYQTIWLGVWEHNARAQAFYRKWDFRVIGAHIFQLGSDPQTDLLMERALV